MRPLSPQEILRIWEIGQYLHRLDQALVMLDVWRDDMRREQLAALTIGKRDSFLLDLWEHTFGSNLRAFTSCPGCKDNLEFLLSTHRLRVKSELPATESADEIQEVKENGVTVRFRLPNSMDLANVATCKDAHTGRTLLLEACITEARIKRRRIRIKELPEKIMTKVAEKMAKCEPQADTCIDLHCPTCGHDWQMIFDIVSFLWTEISLTAKRLLRSVHILASAYHWREEDILSMSPMRRQSYLAMVS